MDVQLNELIQTIKNEGVKNAEEEAARIVAEARRRAADIVREAEGESQKAIEKAKAEVARSERAGRDALSQASRDLLLNLRAGIIKVFGSIVETEIAAALDGKLLEEAVIALMKSWDGGELGKLAVVLPKTSLEKIESALRSRLSSEIRSGLEIKAGEGARKGFIVTEKDGNAFYNFTSGAIAEILTDYLNPRLAELIKEAETSA